MSQVSRIDINKVEDYRISVSGDEAKLSWLDELIKSSWRQKMDLGCFRYKFEHPECKKLPGKIGYVAQLNPFRVSARRQPEAMMSVKQPFQPEKFNFNKADLVKELVFEVENTDHICIINVSPIEFGHCLFVPDVKECLPQLLSFSSILSALKLVLLSWDRAFKMAFNSLCAYASVNHQHWHLYYLHEAFQVPTAFIKASRPLMAAANLFEISSEDYPSSGFALQLAQIEDLETVARDAFKIVQYLSENEIAHNVFITRGANFLPCDDEVIRIFIWPRQSVYGNKHPGDFCVAVCELSGQMLIYNQDTYDSITEEVVMKAHEETCAEVFTAVKPAILDLFK